MDILNTSNINIVLNEFRFDYCRNCKNKECNGTDPLSCYHCKFFVDFCKDNGIRWEELRKIVNSGESDISEKENNTVGYPFLYDMFLPGAVDIMEKNDNIVPFPSVSDEKVKVKRTRAERRKNSFKKQNRKRKIAVQGNQYNPFKGYVDYDYVDGKLSPVGKYVKYIGKSNHQKYLKKQTNKRLRKRIIQDEEFGRKGNHYRKDSGVDFWWELT